MREILKVLAYFNWFTPLEIVTRRVFEGRSYSFKVHESCGWSGIQIVNMLRQQGGIKTTGYMFVNDHYMFNVPIQQARFAQYLMDRAGIPVANPMTARRQHPIRGNVRPMRFGGVWKRK